MKKLLVNLLKKFIKTDESKISDIEESEFVEPIVFVNKPIANIEEDIVGFETQISTIKEAIENGDASLIGLVADYGAGKSSIADLLYKNNTNYQKIRVNLWDSISKSDKTNDNENISLLTKSFLYQLASGYDSKPENITNTSKLTSYVTKMMSNNYNVLSFATSLKTIWENFKVAVCLFILYVFCQAEKVSTLFSNEFFVFLNDISPIIFVFSAIALINGMKDTIITFSNFKRAEARQLEISDVFDVYNVIVDKLVNNDYDATQIIIIEDLDRIREKKLIIGFLKEIYRFHNLLSDNIKNKFVFIIALKPESSLEGDESNEENIYSKIFDLIVYLKPIHVSDYEAVLLNLINNDSKSKFRLIKLLSDSNNLEANEKMFAGKRLPSSFKWLMKGENLTIRQLKDRLNQAIEIMVSLKNKKYESTKERGAIKFEACAAVAYLEAVYPKDYYNLIELENEFSNLVLETYKLKHTCDPEKYYDELISEFSKKLEAKSTVNAGNTTNKNERNSKSFSEEFKRDIALLIVEGILDEDFRMYFYTYPKNSYIKNVDEKYICDTLLRPYTYTGINERLKLSVERVFANGQNDVVIDTLIRVAENNELHWAVFESDILLQASLNVDLDQTEDVLCKKLFPILSKFSRYEYLFDRMNKLNDPNVTTLLDDFIYDLYDYITGNKKKSDTIITVRKVLIKIFKERTEMFIRLFFDDKGGNIPFVTKDELFSYNDINVGLQLIDVNLLDEKNYTYIFEYINSKKLSQEEYGKAKEIIKAIGNTVGVSQIVDMILKFLDTNNSVEADFFNDIVSYCENTTAIVNYVNSIVDKLSNSYLEIIDKWCKNAKFSQSVLAKLKECKLFSTYIVSCSDEQLNEIDFDEETNINPIIQALDHIWKKHGDLFIKKRRHLIKNSSFVERNYINLFKETYPLITLGELKSLDDFHEAANCICGKLVSEENVSYIAEYFNENADDVDKCKKIFDRFFVPGGENTITNSTVLVSLFNLLDFEKIPFAQLSHQEREEYVKIFKSYKGLTSPQNAIDFMRKIGCLVQSLETTLMSNSSYHAKYRELINELNECTDKTIDWIIRQPIYPWNSNVCEALVSRGEKERYVISKTLYSKRFIYEPEKITMDIYVKIYKENKNNMFEYMRLNSKFLGDILKFKLYEDMTITFIRPLYYLPNDIHFVKFVFLKVDGNEKVFYLKNFRTMATSLDCHLFIEILFKEENVDMLTDFHLRNTIYNKLNDSGNKSKFTRSWNNFEKKRRESNKEETSTSA